MKKSKAEIKEAIKKHYGEAITRSSGCCGPAPSGADADVDNWMGRVAGYTFEELTELPDGIASFGCGNPVAFTSVKEGQVVLDLGSGAGLDLILAAKKVGAKGRAIGLDMTPQMIETCRRNLEKAGITNAEVRQGEMENMPVGNSEIDWIISNCVINLSPEKNKVFSEAYRVLKPGGEMMVSDIVTMGLSDEVREDMNAWVGCVAGAVEEDEYIRLAERAGFDDVKIFGKHVYSADNMLGMADDTCCCGPGEQAGKTPDTNSYANKVASVRLYAKKPK